MRVLRAGAAALLLGLMFAPVALAQGPLELTTAYPAVTADPGSTVKFPIVVLTDTPERVDLSTTTVPDGWTVTLRGGGSTVSAVNTAPQPISSGSTTTQNEGVFTAEVAVPADVAAGDNQVVIQGRTPAGVTATITLDLKTQAQAAGDVTMTTDFPNLKGSTSTAFKYNLTLRNNTNEQLTFSLDTQGPTGWSVTAQPSGESQATTATVDAGSSATIAVTVDPPADATAGTYNVTVTAQGGPAPVDTALTVEITGSYSLTLSTSDQRLNASATAGGTSTLNLLVTNTGTAPLTNVKLTSSAPSKWKITFDQDTIASIPAGDPTAGAQVPVVVTIQPPSDAVAGDYQLTIRATPSDQSTAAQAIQIRTTVDTSPIGLLIGIGILIVVAAGLFFVFQRYGRR